MIIKKAAFQKSATDPDKYPNYPYPEFAFIGRSNTGKSSLISMIFDGKVTVKTGSRPGHTQTINFFTINDALSIADLPGYGFAKAPESIKVKLIPMIIDYLSERRNLRIAFLLIDSRRKISGEDAEFLDILSRRNIPTAIVLTKIDKLTQRELSAQKTKIAEDLGISVEDIYLTSYTKRRGREDILNLIEENSSRSKPQE